MPRCSKQVCERFEKQAKNQCNRSAESDTSSPAGRVIVSMLDNSNLEFSSVSVLKLSLNIFALSSSFSVDELTCIYFLCCSNVFNCVLLFFSGWALRMPFCKYELYIFFTTPLYIYMCPSTCALCQKVAVSSSDKLRLGTGFIFEYFFQFAVPHLENFVFFSHAPRVGRI